MDLKLVQRFLPYAAIAIITTLSLWSRRSQRCRAKPGRSNDSEDGEAEVFSIPSSSSSLGRSNNPYDEDAEVSSLPSSSPSLGKSNDPDDEDAEVSSLPSSSPSLGRSNDPDDEDAEVSSLPSSCPPPVREGGFQYDVFLSFRGSDTRKTFAGLLYEALQAKGIITFIDSEKLEKGQKLELLLECIQRSEIFVPIFSPGYADSEWCLKEIAEMVECKRVILPLFVDVEPRDVRRQTGPFESAFSKHRKNKTIAQVEVSQWRNALKEAGSASGYTLAATDGYLLKLIQQIVKRILNEVNKTSKLLVAQHPVGLDSRVVDVIKVLKIEAQGDVRTVGIYGMGGLGKTTLSLAVYKEISSRFDACSFISNVREAAERPSGLVSVQKQLLDDVFNDKDVTISNTSDGRGKIEKRIGAKKVLLVLDDVNDASQINELVGQLAWFRSGSRIIITTRNKRVLTLAGVKENHVYELKGLDDIQSLELFSWHAFGKKEPDEKFADLSNEVASTAAGLPLALTIFGSHFFDLKTVELWRDTLRKLKENPDRKIFETLRISFDVLDENEKEIFLDIACFFVGQETKRPTLMWEACGFSPKIAISWLIHKSLVSINYEGKFEMHDHVRDMGRQIVQTKAEEAGKHSRLWKDDETVDVLANKRGTEDVEAVKLLCEGEDSVYVEYLAAMSQLRMLLLQDVTLKGGYEHFPRKLRWLKLSSEALEKFPSSFHLQVFNQLKVLDLSDCVNLSICPDFANMIHLEMLSFDGCEEMSELHPSIGLLKRLTHLSLRECSSLKELPQEVWQLTKLKEFDLCNCTEMTTFPSLKQHLLGELKVLKLNGCRNLTMCPDFMGMPHLEILDFEGCKKMSELHPSIGHLKSLTNLNLRYCVSLKEVPQEVWQLTSLQKLILSCCHQIIALPSHIRNAESLKLPLLERLDLSDCSNLIRCPDFKSMPHLHTLDFRGCEKITELDHSIGQLRSLMELDLAYCHSLKELPQEIGQSTSLEQLTLRGCSLLKEVPQEVWQLTSLKELNLYGCSQITTLPSQTRNAESLKQLLLERLDLSGCSNLMTCPDFTSMPHLQELCFRGCEKITKLDPSIGKLKRLTNLDLRDCESLKELPQEIGQLTSLKQLTLTGCSSLKEVPQEVWQLTSLQVLNLYGCNQITALPSQIENAESLKQPLLEIFDIRNCDNLITCPHFTSMPHLQILSFSGCEKIAELDPSIGQLKRLMCLNLSDCKSLMELPQEIGQLTSLKQLTLMGCSSLKEVSLLPPFLNELNTSHCDQLESMADVSNLKGLESLSLNGCISLEDVPGIEQLKCLKTLRVGGCRRLADSLFKRVQGLDILEELELHKLENLTKRPAFTSLLNWLSSLRYLRDLDLSWTDIEELPVLTSSVEGLTKLKLTGCRKLVHIPGIEQLKRLEVLLLAECRSLHDSFFERLQDANFQDLRWFSIPGKLINDELSNPQSITFILPKQFNYGLLCLYVDQRSLDNICPELEKSNGALTLPDQGIASEDEVMQPVDSQLGRSVVRIDITTDDPQFSFPTSISDWDESGRFPTATFARDSKLMMMAKQGRFKGRGMMKMRVSIDGCILPHGDLWTSKWTITDEDLDACRVGHNIVVVKFGY